MDRKNRAAQTVKDGNMPNKKRSLALNAVLNGLRVISNMIVPLISLPYLTRVLQTENYGKVGFCNSIVSYFVLLAGLGISSYAIREGARIREDKNALTAFSHEILGIHAASTLLAYGLFFGVLFLWRPSGDYMRILLAMSPIIAAGVVGFDWLPNVIEDFLYITLRGLLIQLLSLVFIFWLVKRPEDFVVYALITGGSSLVTACLNLAYAKKQIPIQLHRISFARRHIRPILVLFANTLMISIYLQSDITMLGFIKNDTSVGLYKVSVQIYSMIKTFINAVTVVVIPRLSLHISQNDKKSYNETASNIVKALLCISAPCIVGLFSIADNCIRIVGGPGYEGSTPALRILCFALPFAVLGNFFANAVLVVNRKENLALIATVVSALVNVGLNVILIPKYDFAGAAVTTVIAEMVVCCMLMLFARRYVSIRFDSLVFVPTVCGSAAIALLCRRVDAFDLNLFFDTAAKIGLSVLAYGGILFCTKIIKERLAARRNQ